MKFVSAQAEGTSLVCQLIMGAGKTTVVGPLLALLLADGARLVTQVGPRALLDMSRSVMRAAFACVVTKRVLTFDFTRRTRLAQSARLLRSLRQARDARAVVVSHPTAVKAVVLKLVEMAHVLDVAGAGRASSSGPGESHLAQAAARLAGEQGLQCRIGARLRLGDRIRLGVVGAGVAEIRRVVAAPE